MAAKTSHRFSVLSDIASFYPIEPAILNKGLPKVLDKWATKTGAEEITQIVKTLPPCVTNNATIGVEVEAEHVELANGTIIPTWAQTSDNSLRENGREFLLLPSAPDSAYYSLAALFHWLRLLRPKPKFSWRTSIHVHLNMRTERVDQILSLLMLYMLFEDSIFDFVGNDRRRSNFCVPLQETDLSYSISRMLNNNNKLPSLLMNWSKYTALNYRPLLFNDHGNPDHPGPGSAGGKGTIEFRHLEGTDNLRRIIQWINIILSLQVASRKYSLDYLEERIMSMGERADYLDLMEDVFGELLPAPTSFPRVLYNAIAYAKECFCPMPSVQDLLKKQSPAVKRRTGLYQMLKLRSRLSPEEPSKKKDDSLIAMHEAMSLGAGSFLQWHPAQVAPHPGIQQISQASSTQVAFFTMPVYTPQFDAVELDTDEPDLPPP